MIQDDGLAYFIKHSGCKKNIVLALDLNNTC